MKEGTEQATSATHTKDNIETNVDDTSSAPSSPSAKTDREEKDREESPPGKPRRVFVLAGSINKKDAKRVDKDSRDTTTPVAKPKSDKAKRKTNATNKKSKGAKLEKEEQKKPIERNEIARDFGDDEHPYEDPSLVVNVNNSTTLKPVEKLPLKEKEAAKKSPKITEKQRRDNAKSQESMKGTKKQASVMVEHSTARSIFAFLVALLLSLIVFLSLFFLLHCHAALSAVIALLVFLLIFVVLGFLHIDRIKCLLLLFAPSLFSNAGKVVLYVLLLYFVIKGPLCNTINNIEQLQNAITCINNEVSSETIRQVLTNAQECVDNALNISSTKNEIKCVTVACDSSKRKLLENCASKMPQLSSTNCHLVRNLSCDKYNQSGAIVGDVCLTSNQSYCSEEFEAMSAFVVDMGDDDSCDFMTIIGMFLPLLILVVFTQAYNYQKNYQTYNDFHNYFLTGHFQCIDQSRTSCDRVAVLPLRKVELRNNVRPSTICQLTTGEKKVIWSGLKIYSIVLCLVLCLILADLYVYRVYKTDSGMVKKSHAFMKYPMLVENTTVGVPKNISNSSTNVNSTIGFNITELNVSANHSGMSNLTGITEGLEYVSHSLEVYDDRMCRVSVEEPGTISKVVLPVLLVLTLFVIFLQVYVVRLQWFICSRFHREREKERVFYLYNKILEDRIQLVENCRNKMKCYQRQTNTLNSLEPTRIVAQQSLWMSKLLTFFHINLRKCVICNDVEKPSFKLCRGADCLCVYCLTCSFDIDKKCLYCDTKLKGTLSEKKTLNKDVSSKESLV